MHSSASCTWRCHLWALGMHHCHFSLHQWQGHYSREGRWSKGPILDIHRQRHLCTTREQQPWDNCIPTHWALLKHTSKSGTVALSLMTAKRHHKDPKPHCHQPPRCLPTKQAQTLLCTTDNLSALHLTISLPNPHQRHTIVGESMVSCQSNL